MYVLRSFPFSFAILWRFIIVLPILIIALTMLGIMAAIFMFFVAFISPIFTIMIAVAFGVGASVVPVMVGMRLGLQAHDVRPKNTYFGVMISAIGYGLFESFCALLLIGLASGLFLLLSPLSLDTLALLARQDNADLIDQLAATSPVLTYGLIAATSLLMLSLRAGLLVPFAGASIGADPNGRHHTPFFAFGHGFWGLLVLVIIAYLGSMIVIPLVVLICAALGFGETLTLAMAEIERTGTNNLTNLLGLEVAVFAVLALFFYLWFFSLICAGGSLRYRQLQLAVEQSQKERERQVDAQLKSDEPPMANDVDMLDLIRSRMPDKKY